jgi:hypothetical protein
MAKLFITEYASLATDAAGHVMAVAAEPKVTSQALTYTTTATSSAFNANTRYVYLQTDGTKAHIRFGTNPGSAVAADPVIVADDGRFFGVPAGHSFKVSAYDGSS